MIGTNTGTDLFTVNTGTDWEYFFLIIIEERKISIIYITLYWPKVATQIDVSGVRCGH